jgi:hypothetical protein
MTGSIALDVVIGMVFIYTLYSLLTTTVVELIASVTRLRAINLTRGITRMLDDSSGNTVFAHLFFKQPLIKYLGSGPLVRKPSYLSAQNFAKGVIQVLKEEGKATNPPEQSTLRLIQATLYDNGTFADKETVQYMRSLLEDAQNDLERFKNSLEQWYDDTMERVSSWYKNWIQVITFIIGFLIAGLFNVDSIKITRTLSQDPKVREQSIAMATALSENKELANRVLKSDTAMSQFVTTLSDIYKQGAETKNVLSMEGYSPISSDFWNSSIMGWMITAIALSLGAPFWFDMLNKVVKLRSSVKIPSKSEPNKDPNSAGTTSRATINPVG